MGFRIHGASGYEEFDKDATYTFNEAGLLVVHLGRGGGRLTYSPEAWRLVEEPGDDGKYQQLDRSSGR